MVRLFCDLMDCSPPGSSVHGISQAEMLEWGAISFSRGSSRPGVESSSTALAGGFFTTEPPGKPMLLAWACMLSHFSHIWLCVTPWTVAHQAPLSMGFCRQDYWSGLSCPPPGDLCHPPLQMDSLELSH